MKGSEHFLATKILKQQLLIFSDSQEILCFYNFVSRLFPNLYRTCCLATRQAYMSDVSQRTVSNSIPQKQCQRTYFTSDNRRKPLKFEQGISNILNNILIQADTQRRGKIKKTHQPCNAKPANNIKCRTLLKD